MNTTMAWHDRKKLLEEILLKGKESATKLQTLLHQKPNNSPYDVVSAAELSVQIFRSFTETLAVLGPDDIRQIVAADGMARSSSSEITDGFIRKKSAGVKYRKGSYKRRNVSETETKYSSTMEDEYAWRKYGQKDILRSNFPRCYFRCTHKNEGCKATKQVQIVTKNPLMYQTTYFGQHTCNDHLLMRAPHHDIIQEISSDPMDSCLLSFQTTVNNIPSSSSNNQAIKPLPKQVIVAVTKEDSDDFSSDGKSLPSHSTLLQELVTSGSSSRSPANLIPSKTRSAYLEEVISGNYSCSSNNTLDDLDMDIEVFNTKFGDLDNNFCFDEEISDLF